MLAKEILIAARKLISSEVNWTQETYARDRFGKPTTIMAEDAFSFCVVGAVHRVCHGRLDPFEILRLFDPDGILNLNDKLSHAEVIGLLDNKIGELNCSKS